MFDVGAGNVAGAPARVHAPIPAQRTGRAVLNGLDRDRRRAPACTASTPAWDAR